MLVGFGSMAQAHMQQMAATGVAPGAPTAACSVSIAMVSGAAGGMVAGGWRWDRMGSVRWVGWMLESERQRRTNGYDSRRGSPRIQQTAPERGGRPVDRGKGKEWLSNQDVCGAESIGRPAGPSKTRPGENIREEPSKDGCGDGGVVMRWFRRRREQRTRDVDRPPPP